MANMRESASMFALSRSGRKLQQIDEQRIIAALPKEIPERTWLEILQKEENDVVIFEIREDVINKVLDICHRNYMERQNAVFTAHLAAQAWLKLINWHFYRHDPGEDPSAFPPCNIPRRNESWIPDKVPDPSPKDTWTLHDLPGQCTGGGEVPKIITTELEYPQVDEIPEQYWFPGKVNIKIESDKEVLTEASFGINSDYSGSPSEQIGNESEILQKVTDYVNEEGSKQASSVSLRKLTQVHGAKQGAGDSQLRESKSKMKSSTEKRKSRYSELRRFTKQLPPLDIDSKSRITLISDCRLRSLRLDTNFEVSSEKFATPPTEAPKKKWK